MLTLLTLLSSASADPCGMVPPVWGGEGPAPVAIERTGLQQTYVFFRDKVQTIAIRPGFTGSVESFGMLVPLPATPALRKIDDRTFDHLSSAVDPPLVTVQIISQPWMSLPDGAFAASVPPPSSAPEMELSLDEVRVEKEEAVGMYEVAVLAAGSSTALQRWMDEHGFRYPDGMDDTVEDYVAQGWRFVAIKAKVGGLSGISPRPGMRDVDPELPRGARFDGYVQGMAFRFHTDTPIIPMRLSVFNGDDTHNRVFLFTEQPARLADISTGFVRRQVRGRVLHDNLTSPLPLVVNGGELLEHELAQIEPLRDPDPYVVAARDLLAADLMSASRGELSLPFEEQEKELLRINEALNLRGAAIDGVVAQEISQLRARAVTPALADVFEMTLSVVDGHFPRGLLMEQDLRLADYTMPSRQNRFEVWNDRKLGPSTYIYR